MALLVETETLLVLALEVGDGAEIEVDLPDGFLVGQDLGVSEGLSKQVFSADEISCVEKFPGDIDPDNENGYFLDEIWLRDVLV